MESSKVAQKKVVKTAAAVAPAAAVAASAPVAVAAAAPVAAAAAPAKKAAAKKADAAPVAAAAAPVASKSDAASTVASTVAATEATTETAVVSPHDTLETLANDMIKMAKSLLETARQAKKEHAKVVKKAEQGGKKRRAKSDGESTHSNSVFLQPSKISPALAKFCGVSSDTMLSRTESTRKIAAYIKEHDLQNPENRREIRADATLTALFALTSEDKLNYFNLQRYIKPHFIKEIKPEVAKAEVKA
jgi:upstream activation factor subunit UAF30